MKKLLLFLIIPAFLSCNNVNKETDGKNGLSEKNTEKEQVSPIIAYAQSIEQAHDKNGYMQQNAVSFDIVLTMGGSERLNATIISLTNSNGIKLVKKDKTSLVYDGENVFLSPSGSNDERARFDVFTWNYFFNLPFKLTDPGTNWKMLKPTVIKGETFNRGKLSFDNEIGDSPDDWYIIYQEPKSELLYAAAYIVTLGKEVEKAEEDPHAIVYHNYELIDGIPIATKWTFHNWSEENGIEDQIGEAKISKIKFVDRDESFFKEPNNAKRIDL